VKIWDIDTGACEKTLVGSARWIWELVELRDGTLLSAGGEGCIRFWDVANNVCLKTLNTQSKNCSSIIQLDDNSIACGCDNNIHIFEINGIKNPLKTLTGHEDEIQDLLLLKFNGQFVSGSNDQTTRVWSIESGVCLAIFKGNHFSTKTIQFKENILANAYFNGEIKFWNLENGTCERTIQCPGEFVWSLKIHSSGALISSGQDHVIRFWSN